MASEKSQVDRLLDAGVYAPLGFVLNREQAVSDLAAVGRKQVAFARSLGRTALKSLSRGVPRTATAVTPAVPPASRPDAAIADYGEMTAKQVIAVIADCSEAEAAWIRVTETAAKNRVTVLRALDARD